MSEFTTIYIPSKGRPECKTAHTLQRLAYPDDWFIVCGDNDETLPQYQKKWGEHVIVFDWEAQTKQTDFLDNFGVEDMASGVAPARNACQKISEQRGELRFWQFDDDYWGFSRVNHELTHNDRFEDGETFREDLERLARFGYETSAVNVGFTLAANAFPVASKRAGSRVFNVHCLPSESEKFLPFRGRLNEDVVLAIDAYRVGRWEMEYRYMSVSMPKTQIQKGGLTGLYRSEGTVRKTAYAIIAQPHFAKLVIRFGRYHHRVNWGGLVPRKIREVWRHE